jgi:uncharacterized membrane protein YgcG
MPEPDTLFNAVIIGGFVVIGLWIVVSAYRARHRSAPGAGTTPARKRQEALFVATFPELQPYFHPEKVLQFVSGWRPRTPRADTIDWNNPPGFGVPRARLMPKSEKGQSAELLDAAGAALASFVLQDHPEGGVIRLGSGKFTVNVRDSAVRYWHPQREFKWSKAKGWRVINTLSDRGIDSSDSGTSFSSDSSSTATSAAAAVAGAAVVAGAGGAFDGGGSSSSWDAGSSSGSRTSY